jgi:Flp pilus assembly CpaF family ATPase
VRPFTCLSTPARYDLSFPVAHRLDWPFLIILEFRRGDRWGEGMIGTFSGRTEALSRSARVLRTALGPAIAGWLEDPGVVEVMLNPDGHLWIDRLAEGLSDTDERLTAADGERIVRLVAHHVGAEVYSAAPRVSAELPETGERFEGLLPPVGCRRSQ